MGVRSVVVVLWFAFADALSLRRGRVGGLRASGDGAPDACLLTSSSRFRKGVKQVSTLGPASFDPAMMEKLFLGGTDVFRLNLSHGAGDKLPCARAIRALEEKYGHPIGILADLQGPKHRVGMFPEDAPKVFLEKGSAYRFDSSSAPGDGRRVELPHPEVLAALAVGDAILLDDGKLRVEVEATGDGYVDTVVVNDAWLSSRKGFNLPDTTVPGAAMTPKDIDDLEFLMERFEGLTVDWIALSFVQASEDMVELRTRIAGRSNAKLLAKLEKPNAVAPGTLKKIVSESDGIMVARGDLGVEMPAEDVPLVQKEIIEACREAGKPVIVATRARRRRFSGTPSNSFRRSLPLVASNSLPRRSRGSS